jgi:hypothetical protein
MFHGEHMNQTPFEGQMSDRDGWNEWGKHVLTELQRLNTNIEGMETRHSVHREDVAKELGGLKSEIAVLQVKAGLWGVFGGALPVVVLLLLETLKK